MGVESSCPVDARGRVGGWLGEEGGWQVVGVWGLQGVRGGAKACGYEGAPVSVRRERKCRRTTWRARGGLSALPYYRRVWGRGRYCHAF